MKTKIMRAVVSNTKILLKSNDYRLERKPNQQLITDISKDLNCFYKQNPKTVAAIIKYIEDHGFQLRRMKCDHTQTVYNRKEKVLKGVDPKDFENIRKICESLFSQIVRIDP